MIASLMMYARREVAGPHARLWDLIRERLARAGVRAPLQLSQDADEMSVWLDPDLVLSQTCGMPYRTVLHGQVRLVGTPDYGLDGCPAGYYRSAIVVRKDDPRTTLAAYRDARFVYNQTISQSGFAAPYFHAKAQGFWFAQRMQSGGHVQSARAVAEGVADIAALDAMSWALMERYDDFAQVLRVLEWTEPTPALPFITSRDHDGDVIFAALSDAVAQLDAQDRAALGLRGVVRIDEAAYLAVPNPPADAA